MTIFLDIESFEVRRAKVDGTDALLTDPFVVNLIKKYFVPIDSGAVVTGINYAFGLSRVQNTNVGSKPYTLTTESIEGEERIVLYALDYLIVPFGFHAVNPGVTNDGDNFLKKLDGGEIAAASAGLSWDTLVDDGEVLNAVGGSVLTEAPYNSSVQVFPAPFVFFGRKDIS